MAHDDRRGEFARANDRRHASSIRRCTAPNGWYGWRDAPWNVGALEVWYWSQKPRGPGARRQRRTSLGRGWIDFLRGQNAGYPEQALERDLESHRRAADARCARDTTPPEKRLADNMLDYNPAATESLVQLMWGALMPGRAGGLLNARLRYFDPDRKRAGVPEDVAALVSELSDTQTTVTLVNLNPIAGAHGHRAGRRLRRAPAGERDARRHRPRRSIHRS